MHIFHALFTRVPGGLEQAYVYDTEALTARGHRVTALLRKDAPYFTDIKARATGVITMQPTGFYDIFTACKIRRLLKRQRPDLIIAHNARAIALMCMAARGTGIRVCGVSHSYKTTRAMRADALIVLSDHMRDHFLAAGYTGPLEVIPNLMHLPPAPEFHTRHTPVVIGAMGRFMPEKGFADFLHALHRLKQRSIVFSAHIGGDGKLKDELHALAGSLGLVREVEWKGWVKDKAAFYRDADIMCVPSREDSFPLVVMDTLAYGIPMVATDAPGPVSMLTNGVNGLLVPRQNPQALADALQRLIENPPLAESLAQAGWQRAQDFGFDAIANKWDKVLKSFM